MLTEGTVVSDMIGVVDNIAGEVVGLIRLGPFCSFYHLDCS